MTEKEQIICKYKFQDKEKFDGKPYCTCFNELCKNLSFVCDQNCIIYEDYKQLARKTRECEELFAKTYQMWMYYIANGINNASDLNIQHLLEDLGKITKMLAELCNIKDSTLSYYAGQALDETNRYRKALEEIEEILDNDDFGYCPLDDSEDCHRTTYKKILDIINKADCRQSAECFCEAKHADTFNADNQAAKRGKND